MSNTVAIVAITSGATLTGAGITAYASQIQARLRNAADREQMQARLQHERSLHDVDELRSILDAAADAIRVVQRSVANPKEPDWVETGLQRLEPIYVQLSIRIGTTDPVTVAAFDTVEALREIAEHYTSAEISTEEEENEFFTTLDALRDEIRISGSRFIQAAQETAGAKLAVTGPDTD
jgi:hypothetical protein